MNGVELYYSKEPEKKGTNKPETTISTKKKLKTATWDLTTDLPQETSQLLQHPRNYSMYTEPRNTTRNRNSCYTHTRNIEAIYYRELGRQNGQNDQQPASELVSW